MQRYRFLNETTYICLENVYLCVLQPGHFCTVTRRFCGKDAAAMAGADAIIVRANTLIA